MKNCAKFFGIITIVAVTVFSFTACPMEDDGSNDNNTGSTFVAVSSISGIPESGIVGTPLTLDGTVNPDAATNKAVVWSIPSATAGFTLKGINLNAAAPGTVTVRATIANGKAEGSDYTQDFAISFTGGGSPNTAIQLNENVWADGFIQTAGGEQYFKFTATTFTEQYIHASIGTLDDINIQLYLSDGTTVGNNANLDDSSLSASRTGLALGQEYFIKVSPRTASASGTYKISFNTSNTPPPMDLPANAVLINANTWADGNIPAANGEQWFTFTSTAAAQYLHFSPGTLAAASVQVYTNGGARTGSRANLSGNTLSASLTLTASREYYIQVLPSTSSNRGAYKIAFNTIAFPPGNWPPANPVQLVENTWADGEIPAEGGVQWFKFTATAETQYIHFSPNTLDYVYVQVYNSDSAKVGNESELTGSTRSASRTLTAGQEYYIRVWSSSSGTYQIGFNASSEPPLPTNAIQLVENTWANGNIPYYGEQWFKFTATASTQYIHVTFVTLSDIYVQVYNSSGTTVGSGSILDSSNLYTSRTVTIGQEYYIRVMPYSSSGRGTYRIVFNALFLSPSVSTTQLSANTWANGAIAASSGEQWFKFTATAATQYIHASFGTLNNLGVQVYDSSGATVGSATSLWSSTRSTSRTLTAGQEYYIRVWGGSGTYQIAFNTLDLPPGSVWPPANLVPLNENTWTDGNIPAANEEQWFKFTATASTQFIHSSPGSLNSLHVQVYDSSGATVGGQTQLLGGSGGYTSRTLTIGQEYYIRVRPRSGSGTYQIAFNASRVPPGAIQLVENTRADGNIPQYGEQWFKFTATAPTQRIYFVFGTLDYLNIQVFDSGGAAISNTTYLNAPYNNSTTQTLTMGQEYYINVWPHATNGSGSGTYQIAFTVPSN